MDLSQTNALFHQPNLLFNLLLIRFLLTKFRGDREVNNSLPLGKSSSHQNTSILSLKTNNKRRFYVFFSRIHGRPLNSPENVSWALSALWGRIKAFSLGTILRVAAKNPDFLNHQA